METESPGMIAGKASTDSPAGLQVAFHSKQKRENPPMNDLLRAAKSRRTRLISEVEARVTEVEKLDQFIELANDLAREAEAKSAPIAAE